MAAVGEKGREGGREGGRDGELLTVKVLLFPNNTHQFRKRWLNTN